MPDVTIIQNGNPKVTKLTSEKASSFSDVSDLADLSIQQRAANSGNSLPNNFWFVDKRLDNRLVDIPPWWSRGRDFALRAFALQENNDILQGAVSSMTKKFTSMNWAIEGPQRVVNRYQKLLNQSEFGQGWNVLLSKTLQDYLGQDKGGFWELIGDGDPDGEIVGPVLGIAHLDSSQCQLTGDLEFPVIFWNSKDDKGRKLHTTRVVHMVDMPSPIENMYNVGFCAISRVIGSSKILLKINQYKNEKLDDLPEAGLLLLSNVLPEQWNDARADYSRERRNLNQERWANVMTMFSLDPTTPASADFTSFANLPDAFNELETTNIYINILALAFGVDAREFWPLSGGSLGTATESEIQHQKARGKGVGDIIGMLERVINWYILPDSATFFFDFKNDEEDLLKAEINDKKSRTIMDMWQPGDPIKGIPTPVTALEIRQMLADNVDYFDENFLEVDITPETEATDMEIAKSFGGMVSIDRFGKTNRLDKWQSKAKPLLKSAFDMAAENYKTGMATAEQVAEFALAELMSKE